MLGTIINAGAIIIGSIAGILIHSKLSQKIVNTVFQGIGLLTLTIGISMSIRSENIILAVISIVIGSILGEWLGIDIGLDKLSERLQKNNRKKNSISQETSDDTSSARNRFKEGFITASMLFCVGSLAILGAIEDGMGKTPNLLFTKSVIDGITAIVLASSFGISILFSAFPLFIYQGTLTLFAAFVARFMNEAIINDLTSVGGILLIGISFNILKIKEIKVINMLPALLIIVILSYFCQ
ncbi:MAG TPA: DUF554 domain-containing protein [Candidatus Avirikenella pullistercoris]|nr:DUF554 domain-containing protein [Candidatus Avirikenella pullistercoris]